MIGSNSEAQPAYSNDHEKRSRSALTTAGFHRVLERVSMTQLTTMFWMASLLVCLTLLGQSTTNNRGVMAIVDTWGALERVALWQDATDWLLPRYTLSSGIVAWGFRAGLLLMFLTHALAVGKAFRNHQPSFLRWMIAPIGAHVIMLLMVPANADIYFYQMSGDLAANGINPYLHELQQFPDHPILAFNHWIDIGTVYGPFWTDFNAAVMTFTGPDPVRATVAFKVLLGIASFSIALLSGWLVGFISGDNRLAVVTSVFIAWQPNMIVESSGQGHNDPVMMLLALAGLSLAIVGGIKSIRGGLMLITASSAIKYVTLPLLGLLALVRLNGHAEHGGKRNILIQWLLDGVAVASVLTIAFLPYWGGVETIQEMMAEPGRLLAHPAYRIIESILAVTVGSDAAAWCEGILRPIMQLVTIGVVAYAGLVLVRQLWAGKSQSDAAVDEKAPWWSVPLVRSWAISLAGMCLLPINAHPWYWTWCIGPVAMYAALTIPKDAKSAEGYLSPPRWIVVFALVLCVFTLVYHTRIARY